MKFDCPGPMYSFVVTEINVDDFQDKMDEKFAWIETHGHKICDVQFCVDNDGFHALIIYYEELPEE